MQKRYTTEKMEKIWSEEAKFKNWAKVELAVLRARTIAGELKLNIPENLLDKIEIDINEIDRIEKEKTKHDVIAFLMHTSPQLPEEIRPHWHEKMTSYDTQDTALSLQLIDSINLLETRLKKLMETIKMRALEYKYTPKMGRTHGVHAEPITFGVQLANYYAELKRHSIRLEKTKEQVSVGKISGAVGVYTLNPKIENIACSILGLKPIIATQIISRDIIADYISTVAIIGGTIEKICVNIRTMQRTEILEAQEFFSKTQRGSSAMPHKRNPIGAENLSGMSRVLRGYVVTALENQNTWDERDIANSGPERIIIPDASILLDYMLKRVEKIISKWIIYPENMKKNLELTKGLIFSQNVQALIANKSNLPREEAYALVREVAQRCWETKEDFFEALLTADYIMKYTEKDELKSCFNLNNKIKHVDHIFNKVF